MISPLPFTLIASDSLLQHVSPVTTAHGGREVASYLVKVRGSYERRARLLTHSEFALGHSVGVYSAGGWDPASEDCTPHLERMRELVQGTPPDQVEKVVVVLGINHIRTQTLRSAQENAKVITQTAAGVFSVLLELARAFPRAEIFYLGTGKVWTSIPSHYKKSRATQVTLAQVNAAGAAVAEKVGGWCAIFAEELPRIHSILNFWDGWVNTDIRDHYGHFSGRGTLRFCKSLRALLPAPAPPAPIVAEPEDVLMPEAFEVPEEVDDDDVASPEVLVPRE